MKAISFNNVVTGEGVAKYLQRHNISSDMVGVHPQLEPVIAKLAVMYPMWTFRGDGTGVVGGSVAMTDFEVSCDGEMLGVINRRYEGREYQICVRNERIRAKMERGGYYKTLDPNKAVAKVKKMFSPRTTQEMADRALEDAASVAQKAEWNKDRERHSAREPVHKAAYAYVLGAGFETFMAHVKDTLPAQEYELLVTKHAEAKQAKEDLRTIKKTRDVIAGKEDGLVITKRGDTYVTRHGDKLEVCEDNTLPEWVRGRLGMLKLIEPSQFLSDIGMRASTTTFVVIKPTDENLTTVSEGETE